MATKGAAKKMTQGEVIGHIAERFDLKKTQVKEMFEELASLAAAEVKSSGEFIVPGFGRLVRSERQAREGRNPQTGEPVKIPAKKTVKFRLGKGMKDSVLPAKKK